MEEAIKKVNELLVQAPNALDVVLVFKDGKNKYMYADNSINAKKVRKEAKDILSTAWQSGAYNYSTIASKLRVSTLAIQAVLDDEFREKTGL
jgi:hypothetical protein